MRRHLSTVIGLLMLAAILVLLPGRQAQAFSPGATTQGPDKPDAPNTPHPAEETIIVFEDPYTVWRQTINSGCQSSDHSYSLNIDVDPADMHDVSLKMTNFDVDYTDPGQACELGPEVDKAFFNDHYLGILTGANDAVSVNSWDLQTGQLRQGSNNVFVDTDAAGTGCWCLGVNHLEVRAIVDFRVQEHTPVANEQHRDFHADRLNLTVTLSEAYDPATVDDFTVRLEYRNQADAWQQVAANYTQVSDTTFQVIPTADLKDGVRYRVTVRGGEVGVKSTSQVNLPADVQWFFWTVPDLSVTDAFDYGGGSTCAPSASPCPGLEIAVFQVARNATMVPGKWATSRLYLRWRKHGDVHEDDQVKEMDVRATVTVDGDTSSKRQVVKRPDLYTARERADAANTINHWDAPREAFTYEAEVAPYPQANAVPVRYRQTLTLPNLAETPRVRFDFYYIVDSFAVPEFLNPAKQQGSAQLAEGLVAIADQFPVVSARFEKGTDLTLGYTFPGGTTSTNSCTVTPIVACPRTWRSPVNKAEVLCLYEQLQSMRSGLFGEGNFIMAMVSDIACFGDDTLGLAFGDDVVLLLYQPSPEDVHVSTVVHEVGHIYGLSATSNGHREDRTRIEGYQDRTLTNRSYVESPENVVSLMAASIESGDASDAAIWIHNDDYATLLSNMSQASVHAAAYRAGGPYLIVSGDADLGTGTVDLAPAYLVDAPLAAPDEDGTCLVELRDGSAAVLTSTRVTPGVEIHALRASRDGQPAMEPVAIADTDGPQFFSASLPWDDRAAALRVDCGAGASATATRGAEAPTVAFTSPAENADLQGVQTVAWSATDVDSANLAFQLSFRPSADAAWQPLTPLVTATSFALDTTILPDGDEAELRVMATDGFNTTFAQRRVGIGNGLALLSATPAADAIGVGVTSSVNLLFASAINTSTLAGGFTLRDMARNAVTAGTFRFTPDARWVVFRPDAPLAPSTQYRVELNGIIGADASALAQQQWVFTTAEDEKPPRLTRVFPAKEAVDVSQATAVRVQFDEAIEPGSLTTGFRLRDASDAPISGTWRADADGRGALFTPDAALAANQTYTARVGTEVVDRAGLALEQAVTWRFTTGEHSDAALLRLADGYDARPQDDDGDGTYEGLVIDVDVEILEPGAYNLNGRLLDKHGELISWATSGNVQLDAGLHSIPLVYESGPIRSNGEDGPYILDSLYFYDIGDEAQADARFNAFRTDAYDVTRFYSILTLTGLPDQTLVLNTVREDAFNLHDYTAHATQSVQDLAYRVLINTNPAIAVSIDGDANVDIRPDAGVQGETDVTIEVRDDVGNLALNTFRVTVRGAAVTFLPMITSPRPDSDNVADALPIASGQTVFGSVGPGDVDDVYRIDAEVGQTLTVLLNGTGGDADLYVYAPGTTDVTVDPWAALSTAIGNEELIRGVVQVGGTWYIDVYAFHSAEQPPQTTHYELTVTLSNTDVGAAGLPHAVESGDGGRARR